VTDTNAVLLSVIDSACKCDIDPELHSRSRIVRELLMVRDSMIGLSDRHFCDSDVLDFLKWFCVY